VDHRLFDNAVATSAVSVKFYKKMVAFSGIIMIGEEICVCCFKVVFLEAVCLSKMSVKFYLATQCYIPEDSTHYSHYYENLKSNKKKS
jgi:hypothetical protein